MDINIPLVIIALAFLITVVVVTRIMIQKKNVKKHYTECDFAKLFHYKSETEYETEN